MLKTAERRVKRALIRLATSVVHTPHRTREEILSSPPRRILVIRQHNQMGDMLLAIPAFRAIKETFPSAEVAVVSARINRDVLLNNPYVDRILTYSRNPLSLLWMMWSVRASRFDLAIVLHTVSFSFTSALLGLLSRARYRVGSTSKSFGNSLSTSFFHLDLPLPGHDELRTMNEAEHNLYPLRALGIQTLDLAPVLEPTSASEVWAAAFLCARSDPGARTLVVHPGAGKAENIWPPEKFADVAGRLVAEGPINLYVVEGPRDADTVARFCQRVDVIGVIRGRSIGDVAAILRAADLVICNDTGVMHVASAAGARTLAVFGPTDPLRWAPRCDNLHIVRADGGNLDALTPDAVYREAVAILARDTTRSGSS